MKFKDELILISELHLDPENPRLSEKGLGEDHIMRELFYKTKVIELIKSICRRGYLPNEKLFVVKENGKNIVVEGNRRLCALKLLKQPSLIPEQEKVITDARETGNPQIGERISTVVMSREDAKEIILYRHTNNPVIRWDLISQAKVYRELIDGGESVKSIVEKYGEKGSNVRKFLKLEQLHCLAKKMPLDTDTLAAIEDNQQFSLSTLERIATKPKVRALLGIDFDENVRIKGSIHRDEFVKGFKKIVYDIANDIADTRTLNAKKDIQNYLSSFKPSEIPDTDKKGEFTVDDFTSSKASKPAPKKSYKKRVRQTPQCVIPSNVEFALNSEALKELFKELQEMSFESYPISVAISFRCFLERSIHQYLLDKKLKGDLIQLEKSKSGLGLKVLIDWMLQNQEKCGVTKSALNVAKKFVREQDNIFSTHTLNTLVHNPHSSISPSRVKEIRNDSEALVREIVQGEDD